MSEFTRFDAPASVEYSKRASEQLGKDYWKVNKGFKFYFDDVNGNRYWVNIPAGYLTDGASVPRAFWSIIPPWGNYGQAAIVHDYLCEYLSVTCDGQPVKITRRNADQIFNIAMHALDVDNGDRYKIMGAISAYRMIKQVSGPSRDALKQIIESELFKNELI